MSELTQVLRHLIPVDDPNILVDASTGDDAAVYRLDDDRALVVTADFFTPIVDDPVDFGRIAAANALSDLYAMGARPLFGLNLAGFPRKLLDTGLLEGILEGSGRVCREAGVPTLGGHTIDDPEPKFGLVAVGEVHPDRLVTNAAAQPGDVLILTKPIGSGVIATALKADAAPPAIVRNAVQIMATLNRRASEVMVSHGVRAATDITGFGLLGHLRNLLQSSARSALVRADAVPLLDGALELAEAGHVPGGSTRNLTDLADDLHWEVELSEARRILLADAQTSGGLLICCPSHRVDALVGDLSGNAPVVAVIGQVSDGPPGRITIT
jgi:selenide,water dikinase